MNQQIICSICFIVVVLISAVTPQTGGGPGGPKPDIIAIEPIPCNIPDRAIATPSSTSQCGAYPTTDINKYLASNKEVKRGVNSVKKKSSAFCRHKFPILPRAGQPGPPGPARPRWTEAVCPSWRRYFRFPTCVLYFGQKCFVLRPWVNLECQYTRCRQRSCQNIIKGLRPEAGVATKIYQCRHTNRKTVIYYIWCPKSLKVFRRSISLPQCCSCMSKYCAFGG